MNKYSSDLILSVCIDYFRCFNKYVKLYQKSKKVTLTSLQMFINNKHHSSDDNPAVIMFKKIDHGGLHNTYHTSVQYKWYYNGMLYRNKGPSIICYSGNIINHAEWHNHGIEYNYGTPIRSDNEMQIRSIERSDMRAKRYADLYRWTLICLLIVWILMVIMI